MGARARLGTLAVRPRLQHVAQPRHRPSPVGRRRRAQEAADAALAARLDAYKADPTIVAGLRALVEHDISVYEFAKAKYDEHWSAPLVSC